MPLIIVVDDDEAIRKLVSRILKPMGHLVLTVEDGAEVFANPTLAMAELIISDVNMPVMDGIRLHRHVRAERPGLPFIFMTGGSDELPSDDRTLLLRKPLDPDIFKSAVAKALQMPPRQP